MLKNQDIIIISTMDWTESVQIMHQAALRLSENNRVLYIGRQFSIEHLIKYPHYFKYLVRSFKGIFPIQKNLWNKSPFLLKPGRYYSKLMDSISQVMMRWRIKIWIKKLGFNDPVIWCFFQNSGGLVGKLGEKVFLYHCVDCFSANSTGRKKRLINEIELDLVKKADIVVGTSRKIFNHKKQFNKNTFYIPNAADTDLFQAVFNEEQKINSEVQDIPGFKFLHLGYLNAKTNINMLNEIFSRHPDWSFIQIGEVIKKDFNRKVLREFTGLPNIHLLGFKNQKDLPSYIKGCDCCLIPLYKNDWTDCVSPLKFFEYAATGKPIIATNIEELLEYKEYLHIAKDTIEFEELMSSIAKGIIKTDPKKQLDFAKANTWEIRFGLIEEKIEKFL
ncbi:glycosyltransferase [Candidatus Dependentiae bacterium]|nr:glycosyltransferase [Candidatus Dependentiae bacterium]